MSAVGLILLKMSMAGKYSVLNEYLKILIKPRFIMGFLFYATAFLLWMYILRMFKLSSAFPIVTALQFIATIIGSYIILHESINGLQIIGIALCFLGISLIIGSS